METAKVGFNKPEKMYALVAQCAGSGLTVKQFCQETGIATGTYYYWHKKYHKEYLPNPITANGFELLNIQENSTDQDALSYGVYAEYKGIRFYQEPSASLLKSLIS